LEKEVQKNEVEIEKKRQQKWKRQRKLGKRLLRILPQGKKRMLKACSFWSSLQQYLSGEYRL
jgi:hypothetical protein